MMKNHPLHQILHPVHPQGLSLNRKKQGSSGASGVNPFHGMWRSLVAHLLWEQGVAGSNPAIPTIQEQAHLYCG